MKIIIKSPQECTENELEIFEELILEGGEVTGLGLRQRIDKAERLIFINNSHKCVAVGAIKNPDNSYKTRVFNKSSIPEKTDEFMFELGWVYVVQSERENGLGRILMNAVTEILGGTGCYATTRANNNPMRRLLEQYSFKRLGDSYISQKGYSLVLYANKA